MNRHRRWPRMYANRCVRYVRDAGASFRNGAACRTYRNSLRVSLSCMGNRYGAGLPPRTNRLLLGPSHTKHTEHTGMVDKRAAS